MSYEVLELDETQKEALKAVPQETIIDLIAPDGKEVRALPEHLQTFIEQGFEPKYSGKKFNVSPAPWSEKQEVTGAELGEYVRSRGYNVQNPLDRLNEIVTSRRQERDEAEGYTDYLGKIGAGLGSLASGITWGASDVLQRGMWEAAELLGGQDASEVASYARGQRQDLGLVGTGIELAGGLATGGALTKMGSTVATRIGLSTAEGALAGVGYTAGQQALGDDTITAENYLWSAGIGGALGFVGQGIGEKLASIGTVKPVRDLPILNTDTALVNAFRDVPVGIEQKVSIPFLNDKNEVIAFANLSQNVKDSYNVAAKTGVNLENIEWVGNIGKKDKSLFENSIINNLVKDFGTIGSPSKIDDLTPEMKALMSRYGTNRITSNAEPFFVVAEETLPTPVNLAMLRFSEMVAKVTGKIPEKGSREYELFQKIYDPKKGLFTKEFFEYMNGREAFVNKAGKTVKEVVDASKTNTRISNEIRDEIASKLKVEALPELKAQVTKLSYELENRIDDILSYNSTDLDNVAQVLRKHNRTLQQMLQETDHVKAYKDFYHAKQDIFNVTKILNRKTEAGKYLTAESRNAIKGLNEQFNGVLKNPNIIGVKEAEVFSKLDLYASRMIEATENFNKMFKVDNEAQFYRAVKQAFSPREAGVAGQQGAIDKMVTEMNQFNKVLSEAKRSGFIQNIEVPNQTEVKKGLLEIGKYREFQELANMVKKSRSTGGVQGGMIASGASMGSIAGASIGGPVGSAIGAILGSGLIRKATLSDELLSMSYNTNNFTANVANMLRNKAVQIGPTASRNLRGVVMSQMGLKEEDTKEPNKYIKSAQSKISEMKAVTDGIYDSIGDPLVEDAIKRHTEKVLDYVEKEMPRKPSGITYSQADAQKVDKLLLSAFSPSEALKKAVLEGDTDVMKHLKELYPNILAEAQLIMRMQEKETHPSLKRSQASLTGDSMVRKGSVKSVQGMFAKSKEGSVNMNKISGQAMPVGSELQKV